MQRKRKPEQAVVSQEESEERLPYHLDESVKTDLRESFDIFKSSENTISRDNIKSIMSNFGWINCSSADLELSIDKMYPPVQDRHKQEFTLQEVGH